MRAEAWPGGGRPIGDVCLGALGPVAGDGVELAEELGEQGDEVQPAGEGANEACSAFVASLPTASRTLTEIVGAQPWRTGGPWGR
jgi:hypothetical protein